jgi:hypothetical protein
MKMRFRSPETGRLSISIASDRFEHFALAVGGLLRECGVRCTLADRLGHLIERNFVMAGTVEIDQRMPDHRPQPAPKRAAAAVRGKL